MVEIDWSVFVMAVSVYSFECADLICCSIQILLLEHFISMIFTTRMVKLT